MRERNIYSITEIFLMQKICSLADRKDEGPCRKVTSMNEKKGKRKYAGNNQPEAKRENKNFLDWHNGLKIV